MLRTGFRVLPSNKEEPLARALAELGESTWKDIGEFAGEYAYLGGGFKYFVFFTPIWGRFPFWLLFFRWVNHQPAMVCREKIDEQKHKMPLQMKFEDQLFRRGKLFITQMEVTFSFHPWKRSLKNTKGHWEEPGSLFLRYPLPETNSEFTPENGWLEDDPFLLGRPIFRCKPLVSGRVVGTFLPCSIWDEDEIHENCWLFFASLCKWSNGGLITPMVCSWSCVFEPMISANFGFSFLSRTCSGNPFHIGCLSMWGGGVQSSQHLTGCHKRSDEISFQLLHDFSHQQWDSRNHYTWISMLPWKKSIVSWYDECSIFTGLPTCQGKTSYINRTSHPSCHPLCCEFLAGRPSGSLSGSQQLASQMYQKGQLLSDVVTHFGIDYYNSTLQIRYDVRKSSTKQPTGFAETNFQITA